MIRHNIRLGDLLVQKGLISEEELQNALKRQKELLNEGISEKLGEILVELGYITEKELLETLSEQLGYPFVDLYGEDINFEKLVKYPIQFLTSHKVLPFKEDEDYVYVATADPLDYDALETIERLAFKPVKVYIALKKDIQVILERLKVYLSLKKIIEKLKEEMKIGGSENVAAIDELLDLILENAITQRATDVHIEPLKYNFLIRGRIDGVLRELFSFEKEIYYPLVSKIKLLSNIDIGEKRKPQDGRFTKEYDGRVYDFRVSTVPTLYGESIVLRILDQEKILLKLNQLGMSEYNLKKFEKLIRTPYGIVFVTGPTGSGKTTTLYAALNELKGIEKKIITIEEPVEYEIPLIQQIPINPKIGLTFAEVLRNILRQDPDIIMIGEVRDSETLNASIQASLTGHLVLSTLHTNEAVSAVNRLVNMGAEPYLVADSLIGVVAQRLVRKICPYCKSEYFPNKEEIEFLKKNNIPEDVKLYKGKGCKHCNFSGYLGREMISEILIINDTLAHLIAINKDKQELLKVAKEFGFKTLIEDGLNKVIQGITTLEEVLRVVRSNVL
jgi:general secretion pathway protein E/type IV pilus assembly protein PilB